MDSRSNWCGLKSMWTVGLIGVDCRSDWYGLKSMWTVGLIVVD